MNRELILVQNNQIELPVAHQGEQDKYTNAKVGTILNNMAYYGYTLNADALNTLLSLSGRDLDHFWTRMEPVFQEVTGANKRMDRFVVYKNFPAEVLEMSEAEYWIKQILMYWGLPNEHFTQEEKERPQMLDVKELKVLAPAGVGAYQQVFDALKNLPVRWNDVQASTMRFLVKDLDVKHLDVTSFGFKENAIVLVNKALQDQIQGFTYAIPDATDVLRLAAAMSDADISLRTRVKFRNFTRGERKQMLAQLELSKNLDQDVAARPEEWKRLLSKLHPGDYKFTRVTQVYSYLYNKQLHTFNAQVESGITNADNQVLDLLKARPGDFVRRLHKLYGVFGAQVIEAFKHVVPKLETMQLLKLAGYVATINERTTLMYAPRGNWSKTQIGMNKKTPFTADDQNTLLQLLNTELSARMSQQFPNGVFLDDRVQNVKLQTNDQKLASYGRGTTFDIPENINFLRTASYWKTSSHTSYGNVWFDNGWNFFDANWKPQGTVCWNNERLGDAAIFSGDPTNSKEMEGRACQMIDIYLDKLAEKGIRYAVWNILAYSHVCFDEADEVMGTLQWGETPETGKLYEPSRAQMVFPLTGQNMTKYVAYVDVLKRKLVYIDANLPGSVQSAEHNEAGLSIHMPAFVEYLRSLPSVADLFVNVKDGDTKILYSDDAVTLTDKERAFVFKPVNAENSFEQINVTDLLM